MSGVAWERGVSVVGDVGRAVPDEEIVGAMVFEDDVLVLIWLRSGVSGGKAEEKIPLKRWEL